IITITNAKSSKNRYRSMILELLHNFDYISSDISSSMLKCIDDRIYDNEYTERAWLDEFWSIKAYEKIESSYLIQYKCNKHINIDSNNQIYLSIGRNIDKYISFEIMYENNIFMNTEIVNGVVMDRWEDYIHEMIRINQVMLNDMGVRSLYFDSEYIVNAWKKFGATPDIG
ncbi:MAG: hypothetical protein AAFX41_08565, partial [Bacteroidota bacterium]